MDTDCDDSDANVNVEATEICNGVDDNCDGNIDLFVTTTCYSDSDGHGYGDPATSASVSACSCGVGWVDDFQDCDDADSSSYPGAPEICADRVDQDCDGTPDDGC